MSRGISDLEVLRLGAQAIAAASPALQSLRVHIPLAVREQTDGRHALVNTQTGECVGLCSTREVGQRTVNAFL